MIRIEASTGVSPATGPVPGTPVPPSTPPPRAREPDAHVLAPNATFRSRLAGPHALSAHLHRSMSIVDAAESALERTESTLRDAMAAAARADPVDPFLVSIDALADTPLMTGAPTLRDGALLHGKAQIIDVRPVAASDLGAVIWAGRSCRLSDLRAGGALDAACHASAAARSLSGAAAEVAAVRSKLQDFRQTELVPAQRDALADVRSITRTGPATAADMMRIAASLRAGDASGLRETLGQAEHARALSLLSS